jgi:hypothetical protein
MTALTRRKDPHLPDHWHVYLGDIAIGSIGKRAGVPLHADHWEWSCGLHPNSTSGTAATFKGAREAFAAAWAKIEPRIVPEAFAPSRTSAHGPRGNTPWTRPVCRCLRN